MKLSKEQRDKIVSELSHPWGKAALMCDGYRVVLRVERVKGMTYRVMTYVNGKFKVAWFSAETEAPEQKFLRKSAHSVCSAANKREMEKIMGKRRVAKDPYFSKVITMFNPDWASGKAALSHLCKVCESVQIAEQRDKE